MNYQYLKFATLTALITYDKWYESIPSFLYYILIFVILFGRRIYMFQIYPFYISPLRKLPHPKTKPHWILGHFFYELKRQDGGLFLDWAEENPNEDFLVTFSILNNESILALSPQALTEVLQSNCYTYVKPPFVVKAFKPILGSGILFSDGDIHKHQRKLLTKAFAYGHINSLVPIFLKESRRLVKVYRKVLADTSEGDKKGKSVELNVSESLGALTLDIIYRAGLGLDLNCLEDPDNELSTAYKNVFMTNGTVSKLTFAAQAIIPGFRFLPFKGNQLIWKARGTIKKFAVDAIEAKIAAYEQRQKTGTKLSKKDVDIISVMIEETGGEWTVSDMTDQLTTFLVAGHETTASAVTLALYLLGLNQDVQDRLRDEIRTQFPDGLESIATYEDVESLKYLNNVIREVLRLTPPVTVTMRMADKDTMIAGQPIAKGTYVTISMAAQNKATAFWGEDAAEFNPDRWEGRQAASNMAFMTFLQGPRACIGRRFAELEFKSILLSLIVSFKFMIKEGQEFEWIAPVTYRPVGGLPVLIEEVAN
ncbi:cytochrome P450 [Limtongia smithiae]|uniref:cytochrome P450 n=1 Tax=Limtongia smithiae TaxID=1125753 RepID=UPI0034CEF8CC